MKLGFHRNCPKKHPDFYPDFGHIFGKVKRTHPDFHQNPVGALQMESASTFFCEKKSSNNANGLYVYFTESPNWTCFKMVSYF